MVCCGIELSSTGNICVISVGEESELEKEGVDSPAVNT